MNESLDPITEYQTGRLLKNLYSEFAGVTGPRYVIQALCVVSLVVLYLHPCELNRRKTAQG